MSMYFLHSSVTICIANVFGNEQSHLSCLCILYCKISCHATEFSTEHPKLSCVCISLSSNLFCLLYVCNKLFPCLCPCVIVQAILLHSVLFVLMYLVSCWMNIYSSLYLHEKLQLWIFFFLGGNLWVYSTYFIICWKSWILYSDNSHVY